MNFRGTPKRTVRHLTNVWAAARACDELCKVYSIVSAMHILFVDDIFETRDVFRLNFRLNGHTVQTASDGKEALEIVVQSTTAIDVIILDYTMPHMNGFEVVRQLKQIARFALIPIILFTGATPDEIDTEAKKLGISRVVYKPRLPSEVLKVAQEVVDHEQQFEGL